MPQGAPHQTTVICCIQGPVCYCSVVNRAPNVISLRLFSIVLISVLFCLQSTPAWVKNQPLTCTTHLTLWNWLTPSVYMHLCEDFSPQLTSLPSWMSLPHGHSIGIDSLDSLPLLIIGQATSSSHSVTHPHYQVSHWFSLFTFWNSPIWNHWINVPFLFHSVTSSFGSSTLSLSPLWILLVAKQQVDMKDAMLLLPLACQVLSLNFMFCPAQKPTALYYLILLFFCSYFNLDSLFKTF